MGKKKRFDYFDAFKKLSELAVEESDLLIDAIENFGVAEDLREVMERAHEIEHRGDEQNHLIFRSSARTSSNSRSISTTSSTT